MLKLITLYTIEQIFEEAEVQVSSMSKLIYLNCLIHHFKDKKATIANSVAFELLDTEFEFEKFKKNFHQLHKAKIITINGSIIIFNCVWNKYIDKSKLDSTTEESYTGRINFFPAKHFEKILHESRNLSELCQMKYKLTKQQIPGLIDLFIKEQTTTEKTYQTMRDCISHCIFWIGKNLDKAKKEGVVVKSSAKRLGT